MYKSIVDFLSEHVVIAAVACSAFWFVAGKQYIESGQRFAGISWQLIGVTLLVAFCGHALLSRSWYSLIIAVSAVGFELWLIRRGWKTGSTVGIQ
jgi:hypothetical protein